MTDWSKLKVTDLKDECKSRGIPLTGLKLKQQYIDKLEEYEAAQGSDNTEEHGIAQVAEHEEEQTTLPASKLESIGSQPDPQSETEENTAEPNIQVAELVAHQDTDAKYLNGNKKDRTQDEPAQVAASVTNPVSLNETANDVKPTGLRNEDELVEDGGRSLVESNAGETKINTDSLFVPESSAPEEQAEATKQHMVEASKQVEETDPNFKNDIIVEDSTMVSDDVSAQDKPSQKFIASILGQISSDTSTPRSSQIPVADLLEDQKNRRKRSLSPVPTFEEISRKKARLSVDEDGTARNQQASEETKAITEFAEVKGAEVIPDKSPIAPSHNDENPHNVSVLPQATSADTEMADNKPRSVSPSREMSEERDVSPAIHPATSSIYIRNLKRPLHIPTLRNHISSLAKSPDPITVFFLDSIRTHAFISFTSITTASRVRTAMHETRFPDEAMREPLFVDYIPDDKVQSWIDQETGGNSFGGRAGGKRFEVIYEQNRQGETEAIFQEVDTRNPQPPFPRQSITSRTSIDAGRPRLESFPEDIHPDRTGLVSNNNSSNHHHRHDRPPPTRPSAQSRPTNTGVGFKALDDLFSSTTTKPKLYFKAVPDLVAQDRLDMLRDLRVDHTEMGRSGDEGMKRYSFEPYKGGREEWVDKGPEFGYGRKGQDRLTGFRGGRGGGGGGYRGRGGDSWRGGK
ncbi:hypothetical protein LTR84_002881 [Exophiala bonariae]|uniref:SAP domain-containing protein n=1 Tax=Exophiala bonariae TaxID=1690606 RepID=A0AAV9N8X1_9EURO|nr:hypothetical protein LTR84_002881 [Exophiala bonariae]